MTEKEFFKEFILFEKKFNLFELEIDDIPIWELSRRQIYLKLKENLVGSKFSKESYDTKSLLNYFISFVNGLIFKNPFKLKDDIDLLVFSSSRKKKNKDGYEDIYIDQLLSNIESSYSIIERSYKYKHHKSRHSNLTTYFDVISFPAFVKSKIMTFRLGKFKEVELFINKCTENYFGLVLKNLNNIIANKYFLFKNSLPLISRLLYKVRPEKILLYHHYNVFYQALIFEAKRQNIKVFELQHGTVGEFHDAYNFPKNVKVSTFPDYFLSWGRYHTERVAFPISSNNIVEVGFPYLDSFKKKIEADKENVIVIISQRRDDIAEAAFQIAKKLKNYSFYFKAHPSEYNYAEEQYSYFDQLDNVKLITKDEPDLYSLFVKAEYVIGVNSTALLEALNFHVKVLLLDLPGSETYEGLVDDKGILKITKDKITPEFSEKVDEYEYFDRIDEIFKSDSIGNIKNIIEG